MRNEDYTGFVKILSYGELQKLEEAINDIFEKYGDSYIVKDIKYNAYYDDQWGTRYTALIWLDT